jgi:hypothetical protein
VHLGPVVVLLQEAAVMRERIVEVPDALKVQRTAEMIFDGTC